MFSALRNPQTIFIVLHGCLRIAAQLPTENLHCLPAKNASYLSHILYAALLALLLVTNSWNLLETRLVGTAECEYSATHSRKHFDKCLWFKGKVSGRGCGNTVLAYPPENQFGTRTAPKNVDRRQLTNTNAKFATLPGVTWGLRPITSYSTHFTQAQKPVESD